MYDKRMVISNFDVPDILAFFKDRNLGDLTPTNIGWAAGFLEGEGCFGRYWHNETRSFATVVHASQDSVEPLDRLDAIFGVGRVKSYVHRVNPLAGNATKIRHKWYVNGHAAVAVMRVVEPLMSSRRRTKIAEIVTAHEEVQDRRRARRENPICARGHLWAENIGFRKSGIGKGVRFCRACHRENTARRRAEKKLALAQ